MLPKIVTIGVYGLTEDEFFCQLRRAHVDTFCDIRARRGMRGSRYAFANSTRLQDRLREMDIRYVHRKDLAPTDRIRATQRQADQHTGVTKQRREQLSQEFVQSYLSQVLGEFKPEEFLKSCCDGARVVALFCVERSPQACHRSLVADRLRAQLGVEVEHIR